MSALKIDRSFVAGITAELDAQAVVASIVELGRAVGVDVIAEGSRRRSSARCCENSAVTPRRAGCGARRCPCGNC